MATEGSREVESSGLADTLQTHVDDIRSLIQCGICVRPLYEPFTIACGHTFCYSCLASWFAGGKSKRTCPDCRAPVTAQPAPAYMVRAIVQMFTSRAELLDKEETTAEHIKNHKEETERLDQDKTNTNSHTGGLFGGLFKPEQPKPYVDPGDENITRCPHCHWELEDGLNCSGCGYIFHPDSEGTDYSGSDLSDTDYDSIDEEDIEDEDDEDEDEDDMDDRTHGPGNGPPYYRPGSGPYNPQHFGFHNPRHGGSHIQNFLDLPLPNFHEFPFPLDMYAPGVSHGGTRHQGTGSYGAGHEYGYEEWGDETGEESYEGSFIDDGELQEREDHGDDSQSDHSTVVGSTREREYSPETQAIIRSARNAAAGSAAPVIQYPQVFQPNSTSEVEDYDWDSEDDEEIQGRFNAMPSYDSDELPDDEVDDEDEDEDEDDDTESSDVPRARVRQRRQQLAVLSSEDEDSEEDASSSPPRAPVSRNTGYSTSGPGGYSAPRTTGYSAPRRTTGSSAPRTTGTSAHNAIALDDSDEEPVGPIRRTGSRRQPRYSPY